MLKKEKLDEILANIADDKKYDFIAEFRGAESKEAKKEVLEKFGIVITEQEAKELMKDASELSDEELDNTSGGGCCSCC
jgi:hypothetical protein